MRDFISKYKLFIIPIIGLFLGNRLYNHFDAWLGILIIIASICYIIYLINNMFNKQNN